MHISTCVGGQLARCDPASPAGDKRCCLANCRCSSPSCCVAIATPPCQFRALPAVVVNRDESWAEKMIGQWYWTLTVWHLFPSFFLKPTNYTFSVCGQKLKTLIVGMNVMVFLVFFLISMIIQHISLKTLENKKLMLKFKFILNFL